ncbi:MAG TPA: 5-(carboxyamino)imidazole ribonucleotide mutase [Thermoanaerobaculia bacterium]|nr:5-(carboxyamino)imidazole ribonucleotide mutase [Thermoanaerobaculia bacterium]
MTEKDQTKPRVGIVMGSDSDWPVMKAARVVLEELGVENEVRVLSAHRTPDEVAAWVEGASGRGIEVLIAGAGGAAHLPGVVAAGTLLPVIGVPIANGPLQGIDALLAIVQMPKGIPVATVGVGRADNAGLLALHILAGRDREIAEKLADYRAAMRERVLAADRSLQQRLDE